MSSGHGLDVAAVVGTFHRLAPLQRLVSRLRTLEGGGAILLVTYLAGKVEGQQHQGTQEQWHY